ncbi:MurR/RpiR family transcriptional regulator [Luteimicrobium xylanilyticum]|uniref:HTH-type transcriptional regulator HexR n=1 Tax=Luteimicrobium xylanilyticum TaxID=1133546 RepID=A0A5P9QDD9_9MICO|nr:MurR/RpiR family transcriptional regulator [Luteimicrobium xylanilyticum]QFU99481.1 HTH-type transcriptional regulator HexR [Luteimicrobium xylanilyticum]
MSDVLLEIRRSLEAPRAAEARVAQLVAGNPEIVAASTITEIARESGASQATVARYCQTLGYRGYRDFRLAVVEALSREGAARDHFHIDDAEIDPTDTAAETVAKVVFQEVQALRALGEQLDVDAVDRVVEALLGSRRVELYGAGASGLAAQDLFQKLSRVRFAVGCSSDVHQTLAQVALLEPGDVAIGFTHSGATHETLDVLAAARAAGATTVAVTNGTGTSVDRHADVVLTTQVRESLFRAGAMVSRTAQLAIVDILFVRVVQKSFDTSADALRRTYEAVAPHRPAR